MFRRSFTTLCSAPWACLQALPTRTAISTAAPPATFGITTPINGEPATHGNGSTIGFLAQSPEQADACHAAGVANGSVTCEDPPGWREGPGGKLYLAYLRDPDGNKLCLLHRPAA